MSVFSVPRALITLAADALEAVVFWLTPHDLAVIDLLWDEATERSRQTDKGYVEVSPVVPPPTAGPFSPPPPLTDPSSPQCTCNLAVFPGRPDPSTGRPGTPTDELVAAIDFGLENCPEDSPSLIDGYPRFTRSNTQTSSVDGEAAVSAVSGPSAGESPAPDSSAVTDAGPPKLIWSRPRDASVACPNCGYRLSISYRYYPAK